MNKNQAGIKDNQTQLVKTQWAAEPQVRLSRRHTRFVKDQLREIT